MKETSEVIRLIYLGFYLKLDRTNGGWSYVYELEKGVESCIHVKCFKSEYQTLKT